MPDKIKLCVECKHCEKVIEELGARKFPEYLCRHPFFISVVHGEIETSYCSVMRSNCNNSCGYIAKWFEPREKALREMELTKKSRWWGWYKEIWKNNSHNEAMDAVWNKAISILRHHTEKGGK